MIDLVMRFFAVVLFALNTPPPAEFEFLSDKNIKRCFSLPRLKKGKELEATEVMVDQE